MTAAETIKLKALEIGFDLISVTSARPLSDIDIQRFESWLTANAACDMAYMRRNLDKRTNPALLLPGAKSVICVALGYKTGQSSQTRPGYGVIAEYARYPDYHNVIKSMLAKLVEFVKNEIEPDLNFKICVDSVPLAERALAARSGLGFRAKNHMLTNPRLGPQLFLGELVSDLELEFDTQIINHKLVPDPDRGSKIINCSGCNSCIRACPTAALGADGSFDVRRCISYLTIEHNGDIPEEFRAAIGNRLFGCDECVDACPYARTAPASNHEDFKPILPAELDLEKVTQMDQEEFEQQFKGTAIHRLSLERLKRNALICIKNTKRYPPNHKS
jgi:epoxyqueuosine reductase